MKLMRFYTEDKSVYIDESDIIGVEAWFGDGTRDAYLITRTQGPIHFVFDTADERANFLRVIGSSTENNFNAR